MKAIAILCCKKEKKIRMLELYMHNRACYFKLLHAVNLQRNTSYILRIYRKIGTKLAYSKYINLV